MQQVTSLRELADLVRGRKELYVRWAPSPEHRPGTSRDELTGVELPGLSVNPLEPEPWWRDQPLDLWLARKLYDYCHLQHERRRDTKPWVLSGRIAGTGPDNEPLLTDPEPVARISTDVLDEARDLLQQHAKEDAQWGPLRRPPELDRA
ncbi:DUF6098 family protein [Amycolatopsis regifaucium]|uniref:Uncharacterized protein n=1 Tax=Amycolatopsis regifaucium TaxID=546365 RepID=A0A154M433_9PSEU|nr:DUF6098 family protein [Amycolatopsis regifaucium]KZB79316.1 hypothetical protein AVL48_17150 [Amycolatopsis regifaucium]OKA07499.1 hypothetical protein ATP06_0216835 [Amycolatopsis regifaucium]SFH10016.1 hypothetical protein SAMN04489731_102448 [Amycolatopsis regifaucium]